MWKRQWNKLKTAMSTPEDYIAEEEEIEEEVVPPEPEEQKYCNDPVIDISDKDLEPIMETVEQLRQLKMLGGEILIRQETERMQMMQHNSQLKAKMQGQIDELRTTYDVEPTVDYALNLPSQEGEVGTFVRRDEEG